jgi:hypothetical protein
VNPQIYLHEVIRTVPGREEPYLASVLSLQHDPTRRDGVPHPPLGQFRTADVSGQWPCAINIWENTWAGQADALVRQFQDAQRDTSMEAWWRRNLHLRRGGYDRLLIPAPYSPTSAELRARGVRGEVFLHEILWLPFGEPVRFLAELERRLLPALERHALDLVGAFRVALRPRQVLTIVGAPDWARLAGFLDAGTRDQELRAFLEYRAGVAEQAEELVLIPARHDPLAPGR